MDETPAMAPRGWYPDPAGSAAWRWWDGAAWTDDLHPYGQATRIVPDEELAAEAEAAKRLETIAVPVVFAVVALTAVFHVFEVSTLSATWHWFSHAMSQASHGVSAPLPPPPTQPSIIGVISSFVLIPAQILSLVLILVFQHRSARVAKRLAIPASVSPTVGVVGWFIPVANLVIPALAFRSLLLGAHPARRLMVVCWLGYLVAGLTAVLAYPAAASSSMAVGLCSAVSLVAIGVSVRLAPQVIEAVIAEHRTLAGVGPAEGHASSATL